MRTDPSTLMFVVMSGMQRHQIAHHNARGSVMSTKLVHRSARLSGLATIAAALLYSGSAFAAYSTPARPTAIEQASSTTFNGTTFVRIAGVQCPGRGDGYFVVPNNGKQQLEIDILINALRGGLRVTLSHNPANCEVSTVGICANNTPC